MKMLSKIAVSALTFAIGTTFAFAGEFTMVPSQGKGGRSVVDIGFSGDDRTSDAQADVMFDANAFDVSVQAVGGASCTTPKAGMIRVITPDKGVTLGKSLSALCRATFTQKKGIKGDGTIRVENVVCGDSIGNAVGGCGATEAAVHIR